MITLFIDILKYFHSNVTWNKLELKVMKKKKFKKKKV